MSSAEDGYCSADSPRAESGDEQLADAEVSPRAGAGRSKRDRDISLPSSPLPAAKRSRRSVEKRVVLVRIGDKAKGGSGEGPPPADSWTWRKYGQKPIKGSPYPRGYYRCSSSKGCPARKQVERSRAEPTLLLVAYTFEHNHASPQPKSGGCHQNKQSPKPSAPKPEPVEPAVEQAETGTPDREALDHEVPELKPKQEPQPEQDQKVGVSLVEPVEVTTAPAEEEEENFDFGWFDQYPTWHRPALYASAPALDAAPLLPPEEWERELQGEDALFAGLGELPECAVVFGRHRELSLAAATAPCS